MYTFHICSLVQLLGDHGFLFLVPNYCYSHEGDYLTELTEINAPTLHPEHKTLQPEAASTDELKTCHPAVLTTNASITNHIIYNQG